MFVRRSEYGGTATFTSTVIARFVLARRTSAVGFFEARRRQDQNGRQDLMPDPCFDPYFSFLNLNRNSPPYIEKIFYFS